MQSAAHWQQNNATGGASVVMKHVTVAHDSWDHVTRRVTERVAPRGMDMGVGKKEYQERIVISRVPNSYIFLSRQVSMHCALHVLYNL